MHAFNQRDHPKFTVPRLNEIDAIASLNSKCGADPQRDGDSSPAGYLRHKALLVVLSLNCMLAAIPTAGKFNFI
jgi:hypothetical protein